MDICINGHTVSQFYYSSHSYCMFFWGEGLNFG